MTPTEKALSRVIYRFENSPKFKLLIGAFTKEFDELAQSREQLSIMRTLGNAQGQQLTNIGEMVGMPRPTGESDERYRWMVHAKIFINTTNMTVDGTAKLVSFVLGGTKVTYTLLNNLAPRFNIDRELTNLETELIHLVPSPLGIEVAIGKTPDPDTSFSFYEDPDGLGFGDINNPAIGGDFASLI